MWYLRGPSMEPMVANNTCRTQEAVNMQPFAKTMLNMRLPQAVDGTTSSKPSTLVVSSGRLDQNLQRHHCRKTHLPLSLLLLFNVTITYWSYCCRRAGRSSSLYFHSKGATASGPFAMTLCDGQSLSLVISSNHWCGLKWFWSSWSSAYNLEGCTV